MYIPFEEMPGHARVWIYQGSRALTSQEEQEATQLGQAFVSQWAAHGNPLTSSIKIFYHQFLVVAVDENFNQASGCSIDASVGLVRELEQHLSTENETISFLDRTKVAFLSDDKITLEPTKALKEKITNGAIGPDTLTFNNLVADKAQFDKEWLVPVKSSWMARYLEVANS